MKNLRLSLTLLAALGTMGASFGAAPAADADVNYDGFWDGGVASTVAPAVTSGKKPQSPLLHLLLRMNMMVSGWAVPQLVACFQSLPLLPNLQ